MVCYCDMIVSACLDLTPPACSHLCFSLHLRSNNGTVLASAGMQADAAALRKHINYTVTMYKHAHKKVLF